MDVEDWKLDCRIETWTDCDANRTIRTPAAAPPNRPDPQKMTRSGAFPVDIVIDKLPH